DRSIRRLRLCSTLLPRRRCRDRHTCRPCPSRSPTGEACDLMGPQQLSVSRPRIILGRHIPPGLSAMPTLFLCSQGHLWKASGDAAWGETLSSRCPMCGAAGEPAEQENVADEQTLPGDAFPPPPRPSLPWRAPPAGAGSWPSIAGYEILAK